MKRLIRNSVFLCCTAAALGLMSCGKAKFSAYELGMDFSAEAADTKSVAEKIFVKPVENLSDDFICGVDISALSQIEEMGGIFYNGQGKSDDIFNILRNNGVNYVRLRVWNNPVNVRDVKVDGKVIAPKGSPVGGGNNSLERDIPIAVRAKKAGMKVLIDFHYSDFWADPAKQNIPQEWKGLDDDELNEALYKFTKDSLNALRKAGATADMVQIGNELNGGFMWPKGKIWKSRTDPEIGGMKGFIRLMKSASKAVRDFNGNRTKIVVHLADGGNNNLYRSVFDPLTEAGLDFDVIGLSFYNYWHGSVDDLRANLIDLSTRYGKELIVAETAYGFTESDGDGTGNNFQIYSDEKYGYSASVQGQATAVRDIIETVASVDKGAGVFYWEPDWIPVEGFGWRTGEGSSWENQAMFDFDGRVLPSMAVWNLIYGRGPVYNVWGGSAESSSEVSFVKLSDAIEFKVLPGTVPPLPSAVKCLFSDGSEKLLPVEWDNVDWKSENQERTVIVAGNISGTSEKVNASVLLTLKINLIEDGSFEKGNLEGWSLDSHSEACFAESNKGNAYSGSWTYKYWSDAAFSSNLTRKFTGLRKGTYVFSVWAMGGGKDKGLSIFAENFDGLSRKIECEIVNNGWKNWTHYAIEIPVTSENLTVGIHIDADSNCWGNFDDAELYLK